MDGHEDLVKAAKEDGTTTAADLALEIVKAEKAKGGSYLADRAQADAAIDVPAAPASEANVQTGAKGGSLEERAKATWDADEDLRAEFSDDFDAFLAFEKHAANGSARILSRAQ